MGGCWIMKGSKRITGARYCKGLFSLMKGLMFSKKNTLLMDFSKERRIDLHNFFVFFPLYLYFLNSDKRVIEIKRRFKPFTLYSSKKKARYLIESPYELRLDEGDKVNLLKEQ